jgi:hypothetical protein
VFKEMIERMLLGSFCTTSDASVKTQLSRTECRMHQECTLKKAEVPVNFSKMHNNSQKSIYYHLFHNKYEARRYYQK